MKKIPTLFQRSEDRRYVVPIVTPGCEWVLAGEGTATRKIDGTCVMYDGTEWWGRREVKPGKQPPPNWVEVDADETTGKRVGWEPIDQTPFARFHAEALRYFPQRPGTYELYGPKINGNPMDEHAHCLYPHGTMIVLHGSPSWPSLTTFEAIRDRVLHETSALYEGIVWHHPDGRMAKIKRRDFLPSDAAAGEVSR